MNNALYRGKRTDNGEWVEGSLVLVTGKCAKIMYNVDVWAEIIFHTVDDKGFVTGHRYSVDPSTVGRYTGLTDKNVKKIFEGDIHERENHFFVVKYGKYRDCETNEDGYGWYFEYTHRKGCEGFDGTENEYVNIIGNIHDNPELLKKEV